MRGTAAVALLTAGLFTAVVVAPEPADAVGFGRKNSGRKSGRGSGSSGGSSSDSSGASSGSPFGRSSGARAVSPRGSGRSVYIVPSDRAVVYPGHRHYHGWGRGYGWGYDYYTGWGFYPWGYYAYGYHPWWGAPPPEAPPPQPSTTTLSIFGGAQLPTDRMLRPSAGLSAELRLDGRRAGAHFAFSALPSLEPGGGLTLMPLFAGRLGFSVVSSEHARLRLEAGATGIVAPDFSYFGPDFGLSTQLALVGPLGLYGGAHVTPFPARIWDAEAGVSLQFGGLAVRGGWRHLVLSDEGLTGPGNGGTDVLSGPVLSAGLVY